MSHIPFEFSQTVRLHFRFFISSTGIHRSEVRGRDDDTAAVAYFRASASASHSCAHWQAGSAWAQWLASALHFHVAPSGRKGRAAATYVFCTKYVAQKSVGSVSNSISEMVAVGAQGTCVACGYKVPQRHGMLLGQSESGGRNDFHDEGIPQKCITFLPGI